MTRSTWSTGYRAALALVTAFSFITGLQAQTVMQIQDNGDSANRVDLVLVAEGYAAGDQASWPEDAMNIVNAYFGTEPFQEYQNYFNVHRVDVVSNESGADHPELGTTADTAFDATFNCANIERLLCVNTTAVATVVNSLLDADEQEIILVVVNDTEFGGAGGPIATTSINVLAPEIAIHEIGHSFGLLADEYTTGPPPPCNNVVEPPEANVTIQTDRNSIKWNQDGGPPTGWIELSTNVPTTTTTDATPGLYEGARYCTDNMYRPTSNSKMRSLGRPFEQINEEQLVKRIYNWVSPLDSSTPLDTTLEVQQGELQAFEVTVPQPATLPLDVTWSIDGNPDGSGLTYTLDTGSLTVGNQYTISAEILDSTTKVRYDPSNVLTDSTSWTVDILPPREDTTPPLCELTAVNPGPPTTSIEVTVQDPQPQSGIKEIRVTVANNATVTIPPFQPGTQNSLVVVAHKTDESLAAQVELEVEDVAGNVTTCDPVTTLVVREKGKPVTEVFENIPQAERYVTVINGEPGVKNLDVVVNGRKYKVTGLKDGEQVTIDVADALLPDDEEEGYRNVITLTAKGKPGASATVMIADVAIASTEAGIATGFVR